MNWIGGKHNGFGRKRKKISGVGVFGWICETLKVKVHGWTYWIKREVDKEVEFLWIRE